MNGNFPLYVQEFINIYLPKIRNFADNTINTYSYSIIVFIQFIESKNIDVATYNVTDITYDLILEYIEWLKTKKKNTATTINLRVAVMKTFFEFIQPKELAIYNECLKIKNIKMLKTEKHIPDYLTVKEIEILLSVIDISKTNGLKELAILSLLFDAGLRVSELCNIKICDLDFNTNTSFKVFIRKSKGNKSRTVLVNKNVVKIIKSYLNTRKSLANDSYLFINRYGNHYTRSGIAKILEKHYKIAKEKCDDKTMFVGKPHPHMMRHSKGMQLAESDVNIIVIRNFLGHSSVETTEIYARITQSRQDEIIMENVKTKPLSKRKSNKEKKTLDMWLRENMRK